MKKVTVFIKFVVVKEHTTIEDVINRIKLCAYGQLIREIRRKIRNGDKPGADNVKRSLLAFTPSGSFQKGRRLENLMEYSQMIVLDIDKLSDDELIEVKKKIEACAYTYACFVSPSGHGLKVLVCVSSDQYEHLHAFQCLHKYYQELTGVVIDPSGKDITRLCYFSADETIYYNPNAAIYTPPADTSLSMEETVPEPTATPGCVAADLATGEVIDHPKVKTVKPVVQPRISDIYSRCINYVERSLHFIEGSRNLFVFNLALQLRCWGLEEGTTLFLLMQDYCFDEREVSDCVKSAYRYQWTERKPGKNIPIQYPQELGAISGEVPMEMAGGDGADASAEPPSGAEAMGAPGTINVEYQKYAKSRGEAPYEISEVEKLIKRWYDLRYNEVLSTVEWRKAGTKDKFFRMNDFSENTLFRKLHLHGQLIPVSTLHALLLSDLSVSYHPFRDYVNRLPKWDGVTDYIGQLCNTVKSEDDEYWHFCFPKWFVAYIASWVIPEVINHTVIVFIGAQGVGKTSWTRLLVPKELQDYVGTAALRIDSKDMLLQLIECVNIVLEEMETLNRKDLAAFKELITMTDIRIRRPYGRNCENLNRVASFIASVNHEQILTDTSGSRRYLCVKVKEIDYQHTVDIDKAIAQAIQLYYDDFKFWFDQDEIRELTHKNEDFVSKSVEEELIETWFKPVTHAEWENRKNFANDDGILLLTATEIAGKLMEKVRFNLTDSTIMKIGRVLKKQGFERVRKGNSFSYLLRLVDLLEVEKSYHTLDDDDDVDSDDETSRQTIDYEEDLFTASEREVPVY